ncbi:MAG: alpha/beta hydrolase [Chitinophagales bacterium]|nr:alpha/beta hydrolase [Chitinophagales bacterium]
MKKGLKIFLPLLVFIAIILIIDGKGKSADALYEKYAQDYSGSIQVDDMSVYYKKSGNGPTLLLIHGVASSLYTWESWHEALSDNFTVVSIDLPAFGLSGPHPDEDYSHDMYMHTISSVLDQLNVKEVYVAGNSFGGMLCWMYALHDKERVKKIVLIDAAGLNTKRNDIHDPGFKLATHPLFKYLTHAITPKFLIERSLKNAYADPSLVTKEKVSRYHDVLLRKGNRQAFSKVLLETIHNGEDHRKKIASIDIPVLILWGEKENMIPLDMAREYHDLISNSKLITYPDGGHIPMEEIPKQTSYDVKKFLLSE